MWNTFNRFIISINWMIWQIEIWYAAYQISTGRATPFFVMYAKEDAIKLYLTLLQK